MSKSKANPTLLILLAALVIFATFSALHSFATPVSAQPLICFINPSACPPTDDADGDNGNQNNQGNSDNNP